MKRSLVFLATCFFNFLVFSNEHEVLQNNESGLAPNQGNLITFNEDLFNELKLMCQQDQEARFKVINSEVSEEEIIQIDREHLPRLKAIIRQFGWPGFLLVGEEGADNIWLLVQHCDQDLDFQKLCLELLEASVKRKDACKRHLAFLTDRVLVNEGKGQLYGTQVLFVDGNLIVCPIEKADELEKRRDEMGLGSLDEYLSLVKSIYQIEE